MLLLDGDSLTLEQLTAIADDFAEIDLAPGAVDRVRAARAVVDRKASAPDAVYGVNTGFGSLAEVAIPHESLDQLQVNLLRSHAAGVGPPLSQRQVRATMALRVNVLAKGFSGIRPESLRVLIDMINRRVHPFVPSRGSVGASGDLAPLAHVALVAIGEGQAIGGGSETISGAEALKTAGIRPAQLKAKEGLALINGTQASAAVLALALLDSERLARAADIIAAMSIDALRGSARPFEARIHAARPFPGQGISAANIAALIDGSEINASHRNCGRVQDAYSMRCAAQVHGAARDALAYVRRTVGIEANSATDNPMVFAGENEIVSGGNFHGAPIAIAADLLTIACAQLATISERRADRLVNPASSGLPPFLVRESGLQSGLMLAQVTAAALASEMKTLAHPASVDTIPTSGNKEDHVSMSMSAALKAQRAAELLRHVLAVELLCAAQAIDLLAPLKPSPALARVHEHVRERVPFLETDRPLSQNIEMVALMLLTDALSNTCGVDVK